MQKPQKNCLFLCYIKDYPYLCTAFEKCTNMVAVVQLVRASDCGSECRGFESHLPPAKKRKFSNDFPLFFIDYKMFMMRQSNICHDEPFYKYYLKPTCNPKLF